MIRAKPLPLAIKLQNLLKVCADARAIQREQAEIIKAALDEGRDNDGFEPAIVRKLIAHQERMDKDPAETVRVEELTDQYKFLAGGGAWMDMPEKADTEIERVMALCSGSKPPKIEAIKKAPGCSQGKAHKLRSTAVARLANSSRSRHADEHEHLPEVPADAKGNPLQGDADGVVIEQNAAPQACEDGLSSVSTVPDDTVPRCATPQAADIVTVAVTPAPEGGVKELAPIEDDLAIPPFLRRQPQVTI